MENVIDLNEWTASDARNLARYLARLNWTVGDRGHKDVTRLRAEILAKLEANRLSKGATNE